MRMAARNLGSAQRAGAGSDCSALRCAFSQDGFFRALCRRVVDFMLRFLCLPAPAKFEFLAEKIGLAFDGTDASGEAGQKAHLRPTGAEIIPPKTWGIAVVERKRGRVTPAD
jgi:hypothetical protein